MKGIRLALIALVTLGLGLVAVPATQAVVEEKATKPQSHQDVTLLKGPESPKQEPKEPEYVKGELIVKLKEGTTLESIKELNDKYKVTSTEKVFKDSPNPEETLKALKDKLANLSPEHEGWYWQIDKESQEYKEYIQRIEKEKEDLTKQIQAQEELITHLEQRQKRAPEEATVPNLDNIYLLKTTPETTIPLMMSDYKANPAIEYAEPNYIATVQMLPNDPYYSSSNSWGQGYDDLWGLKKIQAEQAWDISQGEGVVVAVIDTGIDYNHEDIAENIWTNPGEIPNNGIDDDNNGYIDDTKGWDCTTCVKFNYSGCVIPKQEDNDPIDGKGHGTHCAGTIAAVGNNSIGIIGIAPRAKVMAVKGLNDYGQGSDADLANALRYAADNGADVLSNSWGGFGSAQAITDAVNYAYAKGCVLVAAAGNSNYNASYYWPAGLANVITVASTDHNDTKSYFSNWGVKIDVAAPGSGTLNPPPDYQPQRNILSLRANGTGDTGLIVSEKYFRQAGTSMACPHVAGLAALVLARSNSKQLNFTNGEIRQVLRISADDLGSPGFDLNFGYGRINAYNALQIDEVCDAKITFPETNGIYGTETIQIKGTAYGTNFQSYKLEYSNSFSGPWTQIGATVNTQVRDDILINWDVPTTELLYFLRLTVTDKDNRSFQDIIGSFYVYKDFKNCWLKHIGSTQIDSTSFVVADVNGDRKQEIIVGDLEGRIHIFKEDGSYLNGAPIEISSPIISHITCADIDNDGDLEIFFAASDQYVYGYHHNGSIVSGWPQYIVENRYSFFSVLAGDTDGNGLTEIIVAPCEEWYYQKELYLYIFKGDGSTLNKILLYGKDRGFILGNRLLPAIADIDKNGSSDIVVPICEGVWPTASYSYRIFDYQGNILKTLKLDDDYWMNLGVVIGDLDKDGDLEIVCTGNYSLKTNTTKLFIWSYDDGNYTKISKDITGVLLSSQIALADIDNNGDVEIILFPQETVTINFIMKPVSYSIEAFNHDGSLLWQTKYDGSVWFLGSPIIGDINGGGDKEVVMLEMSEDDLQNGFFKLHIYNNIGQKITEYKFPVGLPYWNSYYNYSTPAIADLDNDGGTELVVFYPVKGWIGAFNVEGLFRPDLTDWPQFQHDYQHTGCYRDPTPPTTPIVTDSGEYTYSTTQLTCSWTSDDPESGIAEYQYRITEGSTSGTVIRDWTPTGTRPSVTATGLSLSVGKTYYFAVKAKNGAGLWSAVGYSDGITIENSPPQLIPIGNKEVYEGRELLFYVRAQDSNGDKLTYSARLAASQDPVSSIGASFTTVVLGDFDLDGDVDGSDLAVLSAAFGSVKGDANYNPRCDFDNNGLINSSDKLIFRINFGTTQGTGTTVGLFTWTPQKPQGKKDYYIVFSVTDNKSAPVEETITITVLIPGDFDKDGDVDGSDLAVFAKAYGSKKGDSNYNPEADLDKDADVDSSDLVVFRSNFRRSS